MPGLERVLEEYLLNEWNVTFLSQSQITFKRTLKIANGSSL